MSKIIKIAHHDLEPPLTPPLNAFLTRVKFSRRLLSVKTINHTFFQASGKLTVVI